MRIASSWIASLFVIVRRITFDVPMTKACLHLPTSCGEELTVKTVEPKQRQSNQIETGIKT